MAKTYSAYAVAYAVAVAYYAIVYDLTQHMCIVMQPSPATRTERLFSLVKMYLILSPVSAFAQILTHVGRYSSDFLTLPRVVLLPLDAFLEKKVFWVSHKV